MRCFLHIDRGDSIIRDEEGTEYSDLETALADARQSARELIMEELRTGRPIPLDWLILVAPEDGVATTLAFASLVANTQTEQKPEQPSFHNKIERAAAGFDRTAATNAVIRDTVGSIRASLRELASLNRLFVDPRSTGVGSEEASH
jgi:4-diphosphocytidyl-2C-methyl-D-erythritol kinase